VVLKIEKGFQQIVELPECFFIAGKITNYKKVNNVFIGIDIKEGNNHIEIQYKARGLNVGLIISIIGLCGLILLIIKERKYEKA